MTVSTQLSQFRDTHTQTIEITGSSDSDYYGLVDERSPDHLFQRSTLIINKATMEDFGDYQCRVENSFGSDQLTIQLQAQAPTSELTINHTSIDYCPLPLLIVRC